MSNNIISRRGHCIYVLAALTVLLFVAYVVASSQRQHQATDIARKGEKALTYQNLLAVKPGMTRDEVVAVVGKPAVTYHWTENRPKEEASQNASEAPATVDVLHETYQYSDQQNEMYVELADGKVESINIQEVTDLGRDSIMFAGVFQFFFLRLAVFFGCLGIFLNLFRGEVLDRSRHV